MSSFFGNIRRWLGQDSRRPARKSKSKLGLEQLEDRCVMDGSNPFNHAPTINVISDQVLQRSKDLLVLAAQAQDVDGDPITFGMAVGDPISNLAPLQFAKLGGSYYDNARGAGERYVWSHTTQTWFYLLPTGALHQFKTDLAHSPLLANVGSSVWANPTILTGAVSAVPKGPSSGDADAYALDQQLQLQFAGSYYTNHRGAGEKYMLGRTGWHYILPSGQVHAFNGSLATSPLVGSVDTRHYDDPGMLHDASPPSSDPVQTWIGTTGQFVVNPPAGYAGSFSVTIFAYDGELLAARTFRVTVPNSAPSLGSIGNQTMPHGGEVTIPLPPRDQDNDVINYKIVVGGDDRAFNIDQQLGLSNPGNYYDNYRGANEKYIMGRAGWYFILPTGALHHFNGSIGGSPLVGTLDASYHANPASLHDAIPPGNYPSLNGTQFVSATYSNGTLRLDAPPGYTGSFAVTINASDGLLSTSRKFYVAAVNNAPIVGIIGSQATSTGTPIQIGLNAFDPDGDPLQYTVEVNSDRTAYDLDQQLGLSYNTGYFENHRGAGEKYIMGRNGWHFILPTGELRHWNGSIAGSPLIANLDRAYYDAPALLHDPGFPGAVGVQGQVSGGVLTLTPNATYTGTFQVTLTAFDGMARTKRSFLGRVVGQAGIVANSALQLGVGVTGTISSSLLRTAANGSAPSEIVYTVAGTPGQGSLLLNGSVIGPGTTFTQDDVNSNRLSYVHSGSIATSDAFTFSVRNALGTGPTAEFRVTRSPNAPVNSVKDVAVQFASGNGLAALASVAQSTGLAGLIDVNGSRVLADGSNRIVRVRLAPGANPTLVVQRLQQVPGVQWAGPNEIVKPMHVINDPRFPQQYHHVLMQNHEAWDTPEGSGMGRAPASNTYDPIIVAVVDFGTQVQVFNATTNDPGHEDLQVNMLLNDDFDGNNVDEDSNGFLNDRYGWNFFNNTNNPNPPVLTPEEGHGTHVSGIIAAALNGVGVVGTAPRAQIMPLTVGTSAGGSAFDVADAFLYAANNGAKIINYSGSFNPLFVPFISAVFAVHGQGILPFISAGNSNLLNGPHLALEAAVLVSATDQADGRASFSDYGTGIDISAPGVDILSTFPGNKYGTISGTSMASPNAAGTAALIWAAHPTWTRDQVAAQLYGTVNNIDAQNPLELGLLGRGRANSLRAVTATPPAPTLTAVGLPGPATFFATPTPITSFSLNVPQLLDTASVRLSNFELRGAGTDNTFGTSDDIIAPLQNPPAGNNLRLSFGNVAIGGAQIPFDSLGYSVGTNLIPFTVSGMTPGTYRVTARSGSSALRNPFSPTSTDPSVSARARTLDGNADGTPGDDFVYTFVFGTAGGVGPGTGTRVGAEVPRNDTDDAATDLGVLNAAITSLQAIRRHATGEVDYDWFSAVMSRTGQMTVRLNNILAGGGDIQFRAYRIVNNVLTEIASANAVGGVPTQTATFNVLGGERIFIWIFGVNFAQGDYDLNVSLA